jgi:hypothetical protein
VFDIYLAEQDECRHPARQWLLPAGAAVGIDVRIFAERSSDEIRYKYADVVEQGKETATLTPLGR